MTASAPGQLDLDVLAHAMIDIRRDIDLDEVIDIAALTATSLSRRGVQITLDGAVLTSEALNVRALRKLIEQRAP